MSIYLTKNQIQSIASLRLAKNRHLKQQFLIEGPVMLEEAREAGFNIQQLILREDSLLSTKYPEASLIQAKYFHQISGLQKSQGLVAVLQIPLNQSNGSESNLENLPLPDQIICLDGITDPGNLGTIIRTADWFGVTTIILGPNCVDPYNEKVLRSSMGSIFHLKIVFCSNWRFCLQALKKVGLLLISTDLAGQSNLPNRQLRQRFALIMGNEAHGVGPVTKELADIHYRLAGKGRAESLNVASAFAIILNNLIN
jgi:TrmH family RNA methyltransferase